MFPSAARLAATRLAPRLATRALRSGNLAAVSRQNLPVFTLRHFASGPPVS